jgi:hypothetical protein
MVGRTFILQEIRQARAIFYACLILSSTTGKKSKNKCKKVKNILELGEFTYYNLTKKYSNYLKDKKQIKNKKGYK